MTPTSWDGKKSLYYHRRIYQDQNRIEGQIAWLERPKNWRYEPNWAIEWGQHDIQNIAKHWVPKLFRAPGHLHGWYQIQHAFNQAGRQPRLATAENVPEELFAYICSTYNKHALSKCSQVCRYWAEKCRPRLFESISLRKSPQRVLDLVDFQKDPKCRFLPYLKKLRNVPVNEASAKRPWLHVLAQSWDRDVISETIRLHGPAAKGMANIRSVHFSVPRSPLPAHFSRNISKLLLKAVHFRRFEDSVRMACELPDLEWFLCEDVTWASLPAELPHRRPVVNRNKLCHWRIQNCGLRVPSGIPPNSPTTKSLSEITYGLAMISLFRGVYNTASFFTDDDVARILALLRTLRNLPSNKSAKYDAYDLNLPSSHKLLALAEFGHVPFLVVHVQGQVDREGQIFSLVLRPDAEWEDGGALAVDWAQLDSTVLDTIPRQWRHEIVFAFEDRSRMMRFATEVVETQMPSLAQRGSVRYAIGVKEQRKGDLYPRHYWYQASLDSDKLRGRGTRILEYVYIPGTLA